MDSGSARGRTQEQLERAVAEGVRKSVGLIDNEIETRVDTEYEPLMQKAAENKSKRSFRRKIGWGAIAVAAAGTLFVGYGAYSGLSLNDKVQRGGYSTPGELQEAVNEGQSFNKVVKVVAIVSGAAALTGLGFILFNQDPKFKEEPASASLVVAPGMVIAQGRF